jgi:hypothetical protein
MAALWLALAVSGNAGQIPVNFKVTVTEKVSTDRDVVHKGGINSTARGVVETPKITAENESRTYEIKMQSLTTAAVNKCIVRYALYGKAQHDGQLVQVGNGQREVEFKPMQLLTVETDPVTFRSAAFKDVSGRVRGGQETHGMEFGGIKVELEYNGSVVATYYDPPSLKGATLPSDWKQTQPDRRAPGKLNRK